jgi:hypothetical protein
LRKIAPATRGEISKSLLHSYSESIFTGRLYTGLSRHRNDQVDIEQVDIKHGFMIFSVCSFSSKNELSVEDAALKISDLVKKGVVFCCGFSQHEVPYFCFEPPFGYLGVHDSQIKFIATTKKDKFFKSLCDAILEALAEFGIISEIIGCRAACFIEGKDVLSGAGVVSIETPADMSSLNTDIVVVSSIMRSIEKKVKNARIAIGYIYFEKNGFRPKEFLQSHMYYSPKSGKVTHRKGGKVDLDWVQVERKFRDAHTVDFYEGISNPESLNWSINSYLNNTESLTSPEFESLVPIHIDLSLYVTNMGLIPVDQNPAKYVSDVYKTIKRASHSFSTRSKFSDVVDIQMEQFQVHIMDSSALEIIGKVNWCISEMRKNNKKRSSMAKSKSRCYRYYDLKYIPAKLTAIGKTSGDPYTFFNRIDKSGEILKKHRIEVKAVLCDDESEGIISKLLKKHQTSFKAIFVINDEKSMIARSRYTGWYKEEGYSIQTSSLAVPIELDVSPMMPLYHLDFADDEYTNSEKEALKHHFPKIANLTMNDVVGELGNARFLVEEFDSKNFTGCNREWKYFYKNDIGNATIKVSGQDVSIVVNGERVYNLNYKTRLEGVPLTILLSWVPLIQAVCFIVDFKSTEYNERCRLSNIGSVCEAGDDIFHDVLEECFFELSDKPFGSGVLGMILKGKIHLERT